MQIFSNIEILSQEFNKVRISQKNKNSLIFRIKDSTDAAANTGPGTLFKKENENFLFVNYF